MKKTVWKKNLMAAVAITLTAAMVGCGSNSAQVQKAAAGTVGSEEPAAAGAVLLSVNPEIEIEYDKQGLVLKVEGMNQDGKNVVKEDSDYRGEGCEAVLNELVQEIYEDGYFENTVAGNAKNIVIMLEEGSTYPKDDFLETVAESVRQAVETCGLESSTVVVKEDDMDQAGYIGLEKAKELVLAQLGLSGAEFTDHQYQLEDGVYELQFTVGGVTYDFEVNALNGKVMEADFENNDDWKDLKDAEEVENQEEANDVADAADAAEEAEDAEEVDDVDDIEDAEDEEDAEEVEDADDVAEDMEDAEDAEEVEDADDAAEDMDAAEEVEDADDVEEEVDDTDDAEEVEDADAAEEVEDADNAAEEVEDADNAAEEVEDANDTEEEVEDADDAAEEVEDANDTEEEVEDADDVEEEVDDTEDA